ncbi:hypothetical protein KIPB_009632, partial [Kipferlia bialata]|eukprot:g9632.t1
MVEYLNTQELRNRISGLLSRFFKERPPRENLVQLHILAPDESVFGASLATLMGRPVNAGRPAPALVMSLCE